MKVSAIGLCEKTYIDVQGRFHFIDIFDEWIPEKIPVTMRAFFFYIIEGVKEKELTITLEISKDNKIIKKIVKENIVNDGGIGVSSYLPIHFTSYGKYNLTIKHNDKVLKNTIFSILNEPTIKNKKWMRIIN